MTVPVEPEALATLLERHGFVAARAESRELLARAAGDGALLDALVARRLTGEPLAWITGTAPFCGVWLRVDPGVYVPRPQSELLARRAAARLAPAGVAVDLCTGAGAVAATLKRQRPAARVLGTEIDASAVACAAANGVEVHHGDLLAPLPAALRGVVDVVVGVVPYVPSADLALLQRDTFAFESQLSYDGGPDGTAILRRVVADAPRFLRTGGALLLELGAGQPELLAEALARHGYGEVEVVCDEDGDVRAIEATLRPAPPQP